MYKNFSYHNPSQQLEVLGENVNLAYCVENVLQSRIREMMSQSKKMGCGNEWLDKIYKSWHLQCF